ncbi:hypothetical protein SGRA_p0006 (plasmid) [Saprospira grandis str. Lewin]|uniref:Uncharacterized protein n=1 Tax=Saprospira grandis (strain Lewin) TaxID=984262 RepID=H6LAY1_SAPGL|nr:hypothetical protein SGRA_p0006 [Saprospira grandis str. Lewin]
MLAGRSRMLNLRPKEERPSDVQQWPSGQTQAAQPPQGRANSELRNVAPAAGRRPQKRQKVLPKPDF